MSQAVHEVSVTPTAGDRRRLDSERLRGVALGALLFLPHAPALVSYLGSRHLGFGTFDLSKLLVVGTVGWLVASFPAARPRRRRHLVAVLVAAAAALWTQLAGFSAWSLLLALASLVLWRHFAQPRSGRRWTAPAACLLVAAVILLPIFQSDLVRAARGASMAVVDLAVAASGLPIERQGLSFLVGGDAATRVTIWQRCSGTATTRVLFVLLAGWFLLHGAAGRALLLAPVQAVLAGLLCNALRILLFLLLTLLSGSGPGDLVHEGLGVGLFATALAGLCLWNRRSLKHRPEQARAPRRRPGFEPVWIAAVAIAVTTLAHLGGEDVKRMEHTYSLVPDRDLRRVHVNHFVEYRGGGGWILLEHPVEACLRARGIDVDAWESRLAGDHRRLLIDQRYRVGGRETGSRAVAAVLKWARPDLWDEPVRASIRLFEPDGERVGQPNRVESAG